MEVLRALAALVEAPAAEHAVLAAALGLPPPPSDDEYTDVLVFQAYPFASVMLGHEGMLGGEARDRIAGFWRALEVDVPRDVDHLSVLLAALANLDAPRARHALYWEHIASWMPPYLATLRRIGSPFYTAWAETLDAVLVAQAIELGPPARLPLHLRTAAPPSAPASLDELLAVLLAPARTGFVIVRDDLVRCARELELGMRAGERRFILRGWLANDAARVLAWLAGEARRQATALGAPDAIASWWRARALTASDWLATLARSAG